jgi:hypothetical protein
MAFALTVRGWRFEREEAMKTMKTRITFAPVLLAMTLIVCAAQPPRLQQPESNVTIESFDWKYAGYQRAETLKGYDSARSKDGSYKVARATIYVFKYTAKAVLKNVGTKSIKEVSWDYVFTDPESGKEIRRFKIQSKQQIMPNESAALTKEIGIDPKEDTRTLNSGKQSVEVMRIEYTDGSVWRRQ